MAEVIAAAMPENAGVNFSSAGLSAWDGSPASQHSAECAKNLGLSLKNHRARSLTQDMLDESDLVLTMTQSHKMWIMDVFSDMADKIYSLSEYAGGDGDISDPYCHDYKAYEICAGELARLLKAASLRWNNL
jgi:protein-tyrosine-phosphatase